jgi:superfamily II DNA/RNA helicase
VRGISSDLEQDRREEVLREFRSKRTRILVATDVISRGIDIKEINMVINFDVPHDAEDYVHRIGRTARANSEGEAVTLVNGKDMLRMHRIEELIENQVDRISLPAEFGETPVWSIKAQPKSRSFRQGPKSQKGSSNMGSRKRRD